MADFTKLPYHHVATVNLSGEHCTVSVLDEQEGVCIAVKFSDAPEATFMSDHEAELLAMVLCQAARNMRSAHNG